MLKIYTDRSNTLINVDVGVAKNFQISLFGFDALGKVSYKYELSGSESKLPELSAFSRKTGGVVIAGAVTDNYGILKKSAIIADRGKLLGISDMVVGYDGSLYQGGGSYKVYQTSACKIGLVVDDDIKNFEAVKSMSLCDADLIVIISSQEEKKEHNFLVRAYAYLFGVSVLLITKSSVLASDIHGEVCGRSVDVTSNLIIPVKRQYVLTKTKRRGVKD
ncbi:MAG: carbon-nitrogen hydrolase family protein [Clostridia bacterium]|nr:carbon-nitrogen hydrolase family protein [Clostridia bacterium]